MKWVKFILVLLVLGIALNGISAIEGNSSSFSGRTKADTGTADEATSDSFVNRFVSGVQTVSQYVSGVFSGRFGVLDDADSVNSINVTFPLDGEEIVRGSGSVDGEDDIGIVSDSINLTAKVYEDSTFNGVLDATCFFFDGNNLVSNSTTNSSGDCLASYDKTSRDPTIREIKANFTFSGEEYGERESQINFSLAKYVSLLTQSNLRDNGKYYDGDEAVLLMTFRKTNSTDESVLFDPQNISASAFNSAGSVRGTNFYPGNITRTGEGSYSTNVTVNYGSGSDSFIKWEINWSDDNYVSYLGSAQHEDVGICSGDFGDFGDWSECSEGTQTRSKNDSSGCVETESRSCDSGDGGGSGSSCNDECTSGATETVCSGNSTLRTRTCGDYDTDSCTEWGDSNFSECSSGEVCSNAQCIPSEECIEDWSCTEWSTCEDDVRTRECQDLNQCSTEENKPEEVQSCDVCQPDWNCEWTVCSEGDSLSYPYNCVDSNSCGVESPEPVSCTERSKFISSGDSCNWKCGEWSECQALYDIDDVLDGQTSVEGYEERTCSSDRISCKNQTERRSCSLGIPVEARETTWCQQKYIEIYDVDTNSLISRIKESEVSDVSNLTRLDVSLLATEEEGYCDYCFDGVQNYDEEGVDCGGSCPACVEKVSFFNWLIWAMWILWLLFGFLVMSLLINDRRAIREAVHDIEFEVFPVTEGEKALEEKTESFLRKTFVKAPLAVGKAVRDVFKEKPVSREVRKGLKEQKKPEKKPEKKEVKRKPRKISKFRAFFTAHKHKASERKEKRIERKKKKREERAVSKKIKSEKKKKTRERKRKIKKLKREVRMRKIRNLMNKLRKWRREGYYGTASLENEIKRLKRMRD